MTVKSMLTKSTEQLNHELEDSRNIQDFFAANQNQLLKSSISEYLNTLLSEKNLNKSAVIQASLLDRIYAYQIFAGKRIPSRNKLIALAFGMRLSFTETQKLLKASGNCELYARDQRDAILLFALHHKMTVFDTNELLYAHGLKLLGLSKK